MNLPNTTTFTPAYEVQAFINEELKETTFDARYLDYFGNRYFSMPETQDVDILAQTFNIVDVEAVDLAFQKLYGAPFKAEFGKILSEEKELQAMIALIPIAQQQKPVRYKDKSYRLFELESEIKNYQKSKGPEHDIFFQKRDSYIYALHYQALKLLNKPTDSFLARYRFQWQLQGTLFRIEEVYNHFRELVHALMEKGKLEQDEFVDAARALMDCSQAAKEALDNIAELPIPPLNNMEKVDNLKDFIAPEPLHPFSMQSIDGEGVALFDTQIQGILNRSLRIFRKNIGRLVQEMEEIEAAWLGRG